MNLAYSLKALFNCPHVSLRQAAAHTGNIREKTCSMVARRAILAGLISMGVMNAVYAANEATTGDPVDAGLDMNSDLSSAVIDSGDCVVALHGLARSAASMDKLVGALADTGYLVANIDYPSRKETIDALAQSAVKSGIDACEQQGAKKIHFVSHSMGGILIRKYLKENPLDKLGRVVMLAPPNQGSEVVDALRDTPGFELLNGPAGMKLGTGPDDIPRSLGKVSFDLGVIAGTRTINLVLSSYLPDPDDGKVSVASARVAGMCDFLTIEVSHPFIMKNDEVIEQVHFYLVNGRFSEKHSSRGSNRAVEAVDDLPPHCTPVN